MHYFMTRRLVVKGSPSCSDLVNSLIKFWPSPTLQVFLEPLAGSFNTEGRCIYLWKLVRKKQVKRGKEGDQKIV